MCVHMALIYTLKMHCVWTNFYTRLLLITAEDIINNLVFIIAIVKELRITRFVSFLRQLK